LTVPDEFIPDLVYSIPGFSDPVSSLSHLLGAGVCLLLAIPLLKRGQGDQGRVASLYVFAFSCVFLLSMSGVFHLLAPGGAGRAVLRRLDHGAIFILIAGTFTPVHTILFRGWLRWLPIFLIWSAAVTGVTLKSVFFSDVSESLGLTLYLGMGWLGLGSGLLIWWRYGWPLIRPLLWGALAYTAGALLEFGRWPTLIPGVVSAHELFHFAVLAGIGFHWKFVWDVAGYPMADPIDDTQALQSAGIRTRQAARQSFK
jgi:channel protein (hemolysin III family)